MMDGSVRNLILLTILHLQLSTTIGGLMLTSSECDCLDQTLTYECTVMGGPGGATVWTGTALNCPSDEIVLLHQRFTDPGGAIRSCNNGATVAQSLSVQDNLYTSQLNVTIVPNVTGKSIMCFYDGMGDGTSSNMSQFSTQIPEPLPAPNNLHISTANFALKVFTFSWNPATSDCSAIHYNILASDCGSCPTTTNHTNVTCTDVPTDGSTCRLAIQGVACESINGTRSSYINVYTESDTSVIQQESVNSVPALISGGIMLFIAVLLIFGCFVYEFTKRKALCLSSPNKTQQPFQSSTLNSEELGNTTYSLCDRGSTTQFFNRHHSCQETWNERTDVPSLGNSMDEYSCLNKQSRDKGNDNQLSKVPRQTRSSNRINKPQSCYSEDVYDKTSHKSWTMQQ